MKSASPTTESMASRSQDGNSPSRNHHIDKKFKPTISQKSIQLSVKRRSNKDVFSALHAEKKQL